MFDYYNFYIPFMSLLNSTNKKLKLKNPTIFRRFLKMAVFLLKYAFIAINHCILQIVSLYRKIKCILKNDYWPKKEQFDSHFDFCRAVLGIKDRFASVKQTKKSYYSCKRRFYGDNIKLLEVNQAYEFLTQNVELNIYTKNTIQKYKQDFFEKISIAYLNNCSPLETFNENYDQFINFYKQAKYKDKSVEVKVKYLISYLNFIRNKKKQVISKNESKNNINYQIKKNENNKKFTCPFCIKKYTNKKTLKMHMTSNKHKADLTEEIIAKYDIDQTPVKIKSQKSKQMEIPNEVAVQQVETEIQNNRNIYSEHHIFRTCSKCKIVFNSRKELILHIKESCSINE
ncbi:hypothetical protein NUSPORA_02072 [Nucleospora cyclopteri]